MRSTNMRYFTTRFSRHKGKRALEIDRVSNSLNLLCGSSTQNCWEVAYGRIREQLKEVIMFTNPECCDVNSGGVEYLLGKAIVRQ